MLPLIFILLLVNEAHAGMNFTGLGGKDKSMVAIPHFKNTEEAVAYGQSHKSDYDVIASLGYWYEYFSTKTSELLMQYSKTKDINTLNKAVKMATRAQLIREAREQVDGYGAVVYAGMEPQERTK